MSLWDLSFWEIDDETFTNIAISYPSICESISMIAQLDADAKERKLAKEAGYDDVIKYHSDCLRKNPIYRARRYLQCANEYGAESGVCNLHKERWLELKAAQIGRHELVWNEEEVQKMLKEDAIKAGYKEGYFLKKDPKFLEYSAREYEKCIAKHGVAAENTICRYKKKRWLKAKAYQNA